MLRGVYACTECLEIERNKMTCEHCYYVMEVVRPSFSREGFLVFFSLYIWRMELPAQPEPMGRVDL